MRTPGWTCRLLVIAAALVALPSAPARAQQKFTYCGATDVVFVIDETVWNDAMLPDVQANITPILDAMRDSADPETGAPPNYRLALVTFGANSVRVRLNLTSDRATFETELGLVSPTLTGGASGDASDEALNTVINGLSATGRPNQTGSFSEPFRDIVNGNVRVRKLIILLTPAPPGGFDGAYGAQDAANARQRALEAGIKGIRILAIFSAGGPSGAGAAAPPIMQDYANQTNGWYSGTTEASPPMPPNLTVASDLILYYLTHSDSLPGADPSYFMGCNPVNRPPRAVCGEDTVESVACLPAAATVLDSWATWDIEDGDAIPEIPLTIVETPASPYYPGDTLVTMTATDSAGASDSCRAIVHVSWSGCTPPGPAINALASSPSSSAQYGTPVIWTASATGGIMPLEYQFWRYCTASPGWNMVRDYGTSASFTWTPAASDVGICAVHVRVRNAGSTVAYHAYRENTFTITNIAPVVVAGLSANRSLPVQWGNQITWTAAVTGGSSVQYQFWRYSAAAGAWSMVRDWGPAATYTWTPAQQDVGLHVVHVRARSAGSPGVYEGARDVAPFAITSASPPTISNVAATPGSPAAHNVEITWTATATGGVAPLEYEFWRYCSAAPGWTLVKPYNVGTNSYAWTPGPSYVGVCNHHVRVRSAGSVVPFEGSFDTHGFLITSTGAPAITAVTATGQVPPLVGRQTTWTASSTGGTAVQYQFWRKNMATSVWSMVQDYGSAASFMWTPVDTDVGVYELHVRARSLGATDPYQSFMDVVQFSVIP